MFYRLLALLLLLVPTAAHAEWYEASTKHFVIVSDDTPVNITAFATLLERYDLALREFHKIPNHPLAPVNRVTVYVVPNMRSMSNLFGEGIAGIYFPRAGGSVSFTPKKGESRIAGAVNQPDKRLNLDPISVLRHEYAHHFMFNNWEASALPFWFVEGFAELHATAVTDADGSIIFGAVPNYRGYELFDLGRCPPRRIVSTSKLETLSASCGTTDLYAVGWLLTHYFTLRPEGRAKLTAYFKAINNGQPLEKAAAELGDLTKLDSALQRYFNSKKLPAFTVYPAALQIAPPTLRQLTPGEAATMGTRIRSNAGVDKDEAPGVYERAVREAAPYPNDVGAQLVLAEAAFDAKHYDVVEAAAARAIAANPKASKAMLYQGMARMAVATAAKSKDPATWRNVRAALLAANRADPDDALPLIYYFRSFVVSGEAPTRNAKDGLYQAYEYSPEDRLLPIHVAYARLTDGDGKGARTALASLAFSPHGGNLAKEGIRILAMIDAGQLPAAAAALAPYVRDPEGELEKLGKKKDDDD